MIDTKKVKLLIFKLKAKERQLLGERELMTNAETMLKLRPSKQREVISILMNI
jgi:hypothetical protein